MTRRAAPLAMLAGALALLATFVIFAAPARADLPLRKRFPLIPLLADAAVSPPFDKRDLGEPCRADSYPNPYSPLAKPLRNRHRRVTAGLGPSKVELRDAFVVDLPRTFTFELVAPPEGRLEFSYRLYDCHGGNAAASARVTIEDALGSTTKSVALTQPRAPKKKARNRRATAPDASAPTPTSAWQDVSMELGAAGDTPVRLTIAFETDAAPGDLVLAWAEPALSGRPAGEPTHEDTNVLWIVIDAVRSDSLGPSRTWIDTPEHAPGVTPTPAMDAIFARGTSFTRAYSMGNQTRTSTTAMIASVHPSIGGFFSHDWAFAKGRLSDWYTSRPPLVTQILEAAGWRVAHFGNNFFLWGSIAVGIDAGFPRIVDFRKVPDDAPAATTWATRFFEDHKDERWAMMLNYTAPHTPYEPPPEWQAAADALPGGKRLGEHGQLPRSYIGEIMWVDHNLGPVFAALDRLDLTKKTLVIITADHGEVMMPWHDCVGWEGERCGFNHSWTLYDDETNVPLVFSLPGRIAPGKVVDAPVSQVDLAPTILDLLGQPAAPGMAGHSIRGAFDDSGFTPSPVYVDGRRAAAIRVGDWKLIMHAPDDTANPSSRRTPEDGPLPRQELYDLAADPTEKHNLIRERAEMVPFLLNELGQVRTHLAACFASRAPPSDDDEAAVAIAAPAPVDPYLAPGTVAENRLMLVGGAEQGPLSGTIRAVGGTVTCVEPLPAGVECGPHSDGAVAVRVVAAPGNDATLTFLTSPWGAPLAVDLAAGWPHGGPLAADRLRVGAWGLALLHPGEAFDSPNRLELAVRDDFTTPPITQPGETAVYFWRSPFVPGQGVAGGGGAGPAVVARPTFIAPEDQVGDPHADEQLGSEVRKALKDLGYTH
ncbi:MAG: sulfatase [Myxococcota bacterium]